VADNRIPDDHPSFDRSLLEESAEKAVYAFVLSGDLRLDDQGRFWRLRRKVGGAGPRFEILDPPVRAENEISRGRLQLQIYVLSVRVVSLAYRVVWYSYYGEIPEGHHIHHLNENVKDNRITNLELIDGKEHVAMHSRGREPWNKGFTGDSDWYQAALASRRRNQDEKDAKLWALRQGGESVRNLAEMEGVSGTSVRNRLKNYRERHGLD
jgi:hypothetical protein